MLLLKMHGLSGDPLEPSGDLENDVSRLKSQIVDETGHIPEQGMSFRQGKNTLECVTAALPTVPFRWGRPKSQRPRGLASMQLSSLLLVYAIATWTSMDFSTLHNYSAYWT